MKSLPAQRNRKLVRYILFELENQLAATAYDYKENTKGHHRAYFARKRFGSLGRFFLTRRAGQRYTQKLGNLTLLEAQKNKECANALYEQKLPVYETSVYRLTCERSVL